MKKSQRAGLKKIEEQTQRLWREGQEIMARVRKEVAKQKAKKKSV